MKVSVLFALTLLLIGSQARFSIYLESKTYQERYNGAEDEIYYAPVNFNVGGNEQTINTAFDTRRNANMVVTNVCTDDNNCYPTSGDVKKLECSAPCEAPGYSAKEVSESKKLATDSFGGRVVYNQVAFGLDTVSVDGQKLEKVPFAMPSSFAVGSTEYGTLANGVNAVFGLGRAENDDPNSALNFGVQLTDNVKVESKQFCFYFSDATSQLTFGQPEGYFAAQDDKSGNSYSVKNGEEWAVPVTQLLLGGEASLTKKGLTTVAKFDTTTKYIWVEQGIFNAFRDQLKNQYAQLGCGSDLGAQGLLTCNCASDSQGGSFPTLSFTLWGAKKQFELSGSDYVEMQPGEKCNLLVRPIQKGYGGLDAINLNKAGNAKVAYAGAAVAPKAAVSGGKAPAANNNGGTSQTYEDVQEILNNGGAQEGGALSDIKLSGSGVAQVILGTSFLKNYYTCFDADNETVTLFNAATVRTEPMLINKNWRIAFIILGLIIIALALFALINVLKKINRKNIAPAPAPATSAPTYSHHHHHHHVEEVRQSHTYAKPPPPPPTSGSHIHHHHSPVQHSHTHYAPATNYSGVHHSGVHHSGTYYK